MTEGTLLKQAGTYSKFIHGCTVLLPELVPSKPNWLIEFNQQQKPEAKVEEPVDDIVDLEFNKKDWNNSGDEVADENEALIDIGSASRNRKAKTPSPHPAARPAAENSIFQKLPFLQHLKNLFDFDQRFVKDGKPIISLFSFFLPIYSFLL